MQGEQRPTEQVMPVDLFLEPFFIMLSVFLVACQSVNADFVHKAELSEFTPIPVQNRTMNAVKLRWEVREDVAAFCATATGMGKER
eukprot:gene32892-55442_t